MEMPAHGIDQKDLEEVMFWAGQCLHASQMFEMGVRSALISMCVLHIGALKPDQIDSIVDDRDKRTLGKLLGQLRREIEISDGWLEALEDGLEARNYVVHRVFMDNAQRIPDRGLRAEVVRELKALRRRILKGNTAIQGIGDSMLDLIGIDAEAMRAQVTDDARRLNAKH